MSRRPDNADISPTVGGARGYRVGITIFVNADGKLNLFENGLRQNVLFLYEMFRASPRCLEVLLLNHGDGEPLDPMIEAGIPPSAIVRTATVYDRLDFVISIGAAMDRETVQELKRRDVPIVAYKCGNAGVISMEATCAQPPRGDAERYFDHDYFDAIWMTPQHLHTYRGWCETVYRVPVEEVPQIWSQRFIEARSAEGSRRFGYRSAREAWRVGILDPNITVMKTSHLPMLVCEAAYRSQPEAFRAFYVTNGLPHADNPHFASFYRSLSAASRGPMTLEPRFVGIDMIADHCDAIVTHHWENGLNYLYYEALAGGYPLIHNSAFLRDYGYYYPDFDALAGGRQLLLAKSEHDSNLDSYRKQVSELLARLNPATTANILLHERLLARLGRKGRAA